mgnify:CR=1 FL=1
MTAYNTDIYAARLLGLTAPHVPVSGRDAQGKTHVVIAATGSTTAWAQNDTINVAVLPKGARVISVRTRHAALGASVTLAVTGNDGSARTFVTAYDASGAKNMAYYGSEYADALAADTTIVATLAGANPTDNVNITIAIEYVSYQA